MEHPTQQQIFLPRNVDMEIIDDLHFLLMDYVRELEKKLKEFKKEVKHNPDSKQELKGQMSMIRKMRENAYRVMDDIEKNIHIISDEQISDEESE